MSSIHLKQGQCVVIDEMRYRCYGRGSSGAHALIPSRGSDFRYVSPEEMFELVANGKAVIEELDRGYQIAKEEIQQSLSSVSEQGQAEVINRLTYMRELEVYRHHGGTLSDQKLKSFAEETHRKICNECEAAGITAPARPLSPATIRRWYRAWVGSSQKLRALIPEKRGNSHSKLTLEQKQYLTEAINRHYLNRQRMTISRVHILLSAEINLENRNRIAAGNANLITIPHYNTLRKHILEIDRYLSLEARYGPGYARKETRTQRMTPKINRHLERVQVDHTMLDVYVDFGLQTLVRPTLTLIIDVFSKAVLGYWLSADPPSAESVMQALRMAVLPKKPEAMGGEASWVWPMHGIPAELVLDNGMEFHGLDLQRAAGELGISLNFTPPRQPYFKSQVERKFREINDRLLSAMPGVVYKIEPEKRSLESPHLTISEIQQIFLQWVTEVLHRTPTHTGETPLSLWYDSVNRYGIPGTDIDSQQVTLILGKSKQDVSLHPDGIRFQSLTYNNELLARIRNSHLNRQRGNPKVRIKWTASDLGIIWVLDPESNLYVEVQAKQQYAQHRSLYSHQIVLRQQRMLKTAGKQDTQYLDAERAINELIDKTARGKVKKHTTGRRVARFRNGSPTPASYLTHDDGDRRLGHSSKDDNVSGSFEKIAAIKEGNHDDDYEDYPDDLDL